MKLFVWFGKGVLEDAGTGQITAIAHNLAEALIAIEKECDFCMNSFPNDNPTEVIELGSIEVEPRAWVTYGSG